jgi:hypothetical protein
LEVAFVHIDPQLLLDGGPFWKEIDEQAVDTAVRRQLNENGLRGGVVGAQLPLEIQRLLDEQKAPDITTADVERLADDVTMRQHRLQSRQGVRSPIVAGPVVETLHVFVNENGAVRGETFQQGQCIFALRSFPQGDGRVRLQVTPEIEHGQPRNRRVGQEGAWRLDFSRDRKSYESLCADVLLAPGQSLVMSCAAEPVGLGRSFFATQSQQYTVLLIRLAQTQKDDLFDAAESLPPNTLSGE